MIILAFDLAASTGVAVGDSSGRPLCFTERLGGHGDRHEIRFAQALHMTKRLIARHKPQLITIEEPIASGVKGGAARPKLAMGYRACVYAMASINHVEVREHAVKTIRAHFIGNGNMSRDKAKAATIVRCRQLGWRVENDNEADAAAVWEYQRAILRLGNVPPKGGLF